MKVFPWQYKNEKVLYFSRENLISFIKNSLIEIFVIIALSLFVFFLVWILFSKYTIGIILWTLILIFWIGYVFSTRYKTTYIITNKRVIKFTKSWLFIFFKKEVKLNEIKENIATQKWLINKLFNIWNLKIIWGWVIWFRWIKYPEEVSSYLSRLIDFLKENPGFDYNQIKEFIPRKIRKNLDYNLK